MNRSKLDADVRAGLNFSIVVGSACFLEGILETALKSFLRNRGSTYHSIDIPDFAKRRGMNIFYNRLEEELELRIATSTGAESYDEMWRLMTGEGLSKLTHVTPLWKVSGFCFTLETSSATVGKYLSDIKAPRRNLKEAIVEQTSISKKRSC